LRWYGVSSSIKTLFLRYFLDLPPPTRISM
jgi:hypothetical protein